MDKCLVCDKTINPDDRNVIKPVSRFNVFWALNVMQELEYITYAIICQECNNNRDVLLLLVGDERDNLFLKPIDSNELLELKNIENDPKSIFADKWDDEWGGIEEAQYTARRENLNKMARMEQSWFCPIKKQICYVT